jgi:hypothetical protein
VFASEHRVHNYLKVHVTTFFAFILFQIDGKSGCEVEEDEVMRQRFYMVFLELVRRQFLNFLLQAKQYADYFMV